MKKLQKAKNGDIEIFIQYFFLIILKFFQYFLPVWYQPLTFAAPTENWVLTMSQRIRIKLQSYDHNLVDKSAEKIVKTVRSTGAVVTGPIPLPTRKRIFTFSSNTHSGCQYKIPNF